MCRPGNAGRGITGRGISDVHGGFTLLLMELGLGWRDGGGFASWVGLVGEMEGLVRGRDLCIIGQGHGQVAVKRLSVSLNFFIYLVYIFFFLVFELGNNDAKIQNQAQNAPNRPRKKK